MKPSVGRIVHYWTHATTSQGPKLDPLAAIITRVTTLLSVDRNEVVVELTAFPPGLDPCFFNHVRESKFPEYGRWSWPEKVEE